MSDPIKRSICANPQVFFPPAALTNDFNDNFNDNFNDSSGNNGIVDRRDAKESQEKQHFVFYFGAEIIDYSCPGDELCYNDHLFSVRVWLGQKMYIITRSYTAFCELDVTLRKKFPKSNIPLIPLAHASAFVKGTSLSQRAYLQNNHHHTHGNSDISSQSVTSHVGLGARPRQLYRKVDLSEMIGQKKEKLNAYLNALFLLPEILLADQMLYFLDEESIDGQPIPPMTPELSEIDILLSNEVPSSKVVLRQMILPFDLTTDSVVVWRFSTAYFDIGFSVKLNDTVILPYQRYPSCIEPVKGSIRIPNPGKVTLVFDNSYSRMRNKFLSYTVRVLSASSYETAATISAQADDERMMKAQQRALLKRYLTQASKNLLAVTADVAGEQFSIPEMTPRASSVNPDDNYLLSGFDPIRASFAGGLDRERWGNDASRRSMTIHPSKGGAEMAADEQSPSGPNESEDDIDENELLFAQHHYRSSLHSKGATTSNSTFVIERLEDEKRSLRNALSLSESTLAEERKLSEQLMSKLEAFSNEMNALQRENTALQSRIESLLRYRDDEHHGNVMQAPTELQSQVLSINSDSAEASGIDTVSSPTTVSENLHLDASLEAIEDSIESIAVNTRTAELESELTTVNNKLKTTTVMLQSVQDKNAQLEELVADLRHELSTKESEQVGLANQITKLKADRKRLKEYATEVKSELEAMQLSVANEKQSIHEQLIVQQQQYDIQREQMIELQMQLIALQQSQEQLQRNAQHVNAQHQIPVSVEAIEPPRYPALASDSIPMIPEQIATVETSMVEAPIETKSVSNSSAPLPPGPVQPPALAPTSNSLPSQATRRHVPIIRSNVLVLDDEPDFDEAFKHIRNVNAPSVASSTTKPIHPPAVNSSSGTFGNESIASNVPFNLPPQSQMYPPILASATSIKSTAPVLSFDEEPETSSAQPSVAVQDPLSTRTVTLNVSNGLRSTQQQDPLLGMLAFNGQSTSGNSSPRPSNTLSSRPAPVISDETVEMVDELVNETTQAAAAAMRSIWDFGKSLLNENSTGGVGVGSSSVAGQSVKRTSMSGIYSAVEL